MFHLLLGLYGIFLYTAPLWLTGLLLALVRLLVRKSKEEKGKTPGEKETNRPMGLSAQRRRTPSLWERPGKK